MIDICDFVVGFLCQLYGFIIVFECFGYYMCEIWYLLGVVGVISVFNFLVVVWLWNIVLVLVCGNFVVWKFLEKIFFIVLVCQVLFECVVWVFGGDVLVYLS